MAEWAVPGVLERVVDGDTLMMSELDLGWRVHLGHTYVRLYGINAPEKNTDEGAEASEYVKGLLAPGDAVTVVSHRLLGQVDNYGRVLASVTLTDGRDLSTLILAAGHAEPYGVK